MLKKLLQSEKSMRRIFGKKEIEIMIKQLEGEMLTSSERCRLSRDIKPKLECVMELSKCSDEFGLKKNQDVKNVIGKVVDVILGDKEAKRVKAILLFGSHADRTNTFRSDIDICVVFRDDISLTDATRFRIRVSGEVSSKVDVQVFNVLPQKIKRSIAFNHRVLHKENDYNNTIFTMKYIKDDGYLTRMKYYFGET